LLELKNVSAQYGEVQVLHDISLKVEKGQLVSIIGSNGAGKSSILKTISGLIKYVSGHIEVEEVDITGLPPHKIAEMGISQVPEGRQILALMSVYENLLIGATRQQAKKARDNSVKKIFEIFPPLYDRKNQRAGNLSGGEQQMLAIARGLMSDPKILMLDEVSLGLSPLITQEMFRVLSQLNKEGLTVLLVDQNLTQALKVCDYGYVLENGRIVLEGSSEQLLANEDTKRAYMGL